ncbi:MAG: DUF3224 domain-containing protein [Myxococcaceae bacterium]
MKTSKGTFEIKMTGEPPYQEADGVTLSRARFDKQFSGGFQGTSVVQMLAARTPVTTSAGYVALERLEGSLDGKAGSFVVLQTGLMDNGKQTLSIQIVPDSGTGELKGLRGTMTITIFERVHYYTVDYDQS